MMITQNIQRVLLSFFICVSVVFANIPLSMAEEDIEVLIQRAEQGDVEAMLKAGGYYMCGEEYNDIPPDWAKAFYYLDLAEKHGSDEAQWWLAIMYDNGFGVPKDKEKAFHYYEFTAEQGSFEAQFYLGLLYNDGEGVEQDINKAIYYWDLAAKQDFHLAQYCLESKQEKKEKEEKKKKHEAALEDWFNLSLEEMVKAAEKQEEEWKSMPEEEKAKIEEERNKRMQGSFFGSGNSFFWYILTQLGDAKAQYFTGLMYEVGFHKSQDDEDAVEYYTLAAEQGYARAQYALATMYQRGRGVVQDDQKAAYYFDLAAQQGFNRDHIASLKVGEALGLPQ